MKRSHLLYALSLGALLVVGFQNCSHQTSFSKGEVDSQTTDSSSTAADTGGEVVVPPVEEPPVVICDPLSGGSNCQSQPSQGLLGNIYYLTAANNNAKLADYFSSGVKVDTPLIMTQFKIAQRDFTSGFPAGVDDQGNTILVKDSKNNDLIEWFALKVSGNIMTDESSEGLYQFALNSDDGAILFIDGQKVIDNDGVHAVVRKESSASGIFLERNGKHAIELQYFQGPRQKIALELFWRKCINLSGSTCSKYGAWDYVPSTVFSH